jgi:DNA-binding transcriptional MerR regulator
MTETYDIQGLITASGVPRRTIYFYVQVGILPPPEGAGLAARYGEEHLLRLRLIPVLRQQGMRLDEIREHFAGMDTKQMRQTLSRARAGQPPPPPVRAVPSLPAQPASRNEARYTHYTLPAGLTLMAPDSLSPSDRQRLELLLQAARQIFSGQPGPSYLDANQRVPSPGDKTNQEE